MNKKQFIDLPKDEQLALINEAFDFLASQGLVPYGVTTGDDDTWDNHDPAIELATRWYEDES
jgi:hypothetical protein